MKQPIYTREVVTDIYAKAKENGTTVKAEALSRGFKPGQIQSIMGAYAKFKRKDKKEKKAVAQKVKLRKNNAFFQDIPAEFQKDVSNAQALAILLVNRSQLRDVLSELL